MPPTHTTKKPTFRCRSPILHAPLSTRTIIILAEHSHADASADRACLLPHSTSILFRLLVHAVSHPLLCSRHAPRLWRQVKPYVRPSTSSLWWSSGPTADHLTASAAEPIRQKVEVSGTYYYIHASGLMRMVSPCGCIGKRQTGGSLQLGEVWSWRCRAGIEVHR